MDVIIEEHTLSSEGGTAPPHGNNGRRSGKSNRSSHRRSQTIVAAGDLEMEQLEKHKEVEELHSELQFTSKALEESQEEAWLAARIGQTLLQRNHELDVESELKFVHLLERAESAEQEVKTLRARLTESYNQTRKLDHSKQELLSENEELLQEVEALRARVAFLKAEATSTAEQLSHLVTTAASLEDELATATEMAQRAQALNARLMAESNANMSKMLEWEAMNQQQQEQIAQLERDLQRAKRPSPPLPPSPFTFQPEETPQCDDSEEKLHEMEQNNSELIDSVSSLQLEVQDLKEALALEQKRVAQLASMNQELQDRLDSTDDFASDLSPESPLDSPSSIARNAKLRQGSLFYELSKQLEEELGTMRKSSSVSEIGSIDERASLPECGGGCCVHGHEMHDNQSAYWGDDGHGHNHHRGQTTSESPSSAPGGGSKGPSYEENDLLKEFFLLTATAVKIAGGGLRNDRCNISNEDLYDEAVAEGISFDQYHKWLEDRLEENLEVSRTSKRGAQLKMR